MNQKTILEWLTGCPASDLNFKNSLAHASADTCRAALKHVTAKGAIAAISARLRKVEKEAPPQAPTGTRALTLHDLDVLPPVRRVTKAAPVSLDVLENQIRDLLQADFSREQEWQRTAIYDRVAIGLCLLKGRALHLNQASTQFKKAGVETVPHLTGKAAAKAEQKAETGFLEWIETNFPGFSSRTARNYMNGARNCGLTSDHSLEDVEALRTAQALHDKTAKELYQLKDANKTPDRPEDPAPAPNLVHDAVRDGFSCLDSFVVLRDQMEPEDFEGVCTRLRETLQKLTGQRWAPADDIDDAAQHGELHEAKAKGKRRKAKKGQRSLSAEAQTKMMAAAKARWAKAKGGRK